MGDYYDNNCVGEVVSPQLIISVVEDLLIISPTQLYHESPTLPTHIYSLSLFSLSFSLTKGLKPVSEKEREN